MNGVQLVVWLLLVVVCGLVAAAIAPAWSVWACLTLTVALVLGKGARP